MAIFKYGENELDSNKLAEHLSAKTEDFIKRKGLKGRQADEVRASINEMIGGVANGGITSMGYDGVATTNGYTNNKRQLLLAHKINVGGSFDSNGIALGFLKEQLNKNHSNFSTNKPEEENKPKDVFNAGEYLNNAFFKQQYNGNKPTNFDDFLNLDAKEEDGSRSKLGRMKRFGEILQAHLDDKEINFDNLDFSLNKNDKYTSAEDYRNAINNLINLANGTDYNAFRNAYIQSGGNLEHFDKLFADDLTTNPEENLTEEEKLNKQLLDLLKQDDIETIRENIKQKQAEREYNRIYRGKTFNDENYNLGTINEGGFDKFTELLASEENKKTFQNTWNLLLSVLNGKDTYGTQNYNKGKKYNLKNLSEIYDRRGNTYQQHLSNTINYMYKTNPNAFSETGINGWVAINGTTDENSHSVMLYNPSTNQLKRTSINNVPLYLLKHYLDFYSKYVPTFNKLGGIIKAAYGWDTAGTFDNSFAINYKKQKDNQKKEEEKKALELSGKTKEQFEHDSKKVKSVTDLSASDWTRIGAAAADFTGAIAAFLPGGSAYSFGQGVVSDVVRAGADIADGASLWDTAINFGKGIGMTVLASLPIIGTEGRLAKAVGGLGKFMPILFAAGSSLSTAGPAYDSWEKIQKNKGTVQDYKNIVNFVTSISSLGKASGSAYKMGKMKKMAQDGETGDIVVKGLGNTKIKLTPDELAKLKEAKSNDEMQTKLNSFGGKHANEKLDFSFSGMTKASGNHIYNRGISVEDGRRPNYDWDKFRQALQLLGGNKWILKDLDFMQKGIFPWLSKTHLPNWMKYNLKSVNDLNTQTTNSVIPPVQSTNLINYGVMPSYNIKSNSYNPQNVRYQYTINTNSGTPPIPFNKNGGTINKLRTLKYGGALFAKGGIKTSENTNWREHVFSHYKDIILKNLQNDSTYAGTINEMQKSHRDLWENAKKNTNNNIYDNYWKNESVGEYLDRYNDLTFNENGIAHAYKSGRYEIDDETGRVKLDRPDKFLRDNRYSGITDDRRVLGRTEDWDEDSEEYKNWISELNKVGYTMKLDKDGYYRLNPFKSMPEPAKGPAYDPKDNPMLKVDLGTLDEEEKELKGLKKTGTAVERQDKEQSTPWEDTILNRINALRNLRFLNKDLTNRQLLKEGQKETAGLLKNTPVHSQIKGDLNAVMQAKARASEINHMFAQQAANLTNAQDAVAARLQGNLQARNQELQGELQDSQARTLSEAQAFAQGKENVQNETNIANTNNDRLVALYNSKLANLLGFMNQQDANRDAYLSELEYENKTKLDNERNLARNYISQIYARNYQAHMKQYADKVKAAELSKDANAYNEAVQKYLAASEQYNSDNWNDELKQVMKLYGYDSSKYDNLIKYDKIGGKLNKLKSLKSGGRVSEDGNKKTRNKDADRKSKRDKHVNELNDKKQERLARLKELHVKQMYKSK